MSGLWDWPALAGSALALRESVTLVYRRGIWGKVHGESSDYRWIARSAGFADTCPDLAGALRLGAEDTPATAPLWRRLPDRYVAAWVYPSRARDSAGRMTVVEKQVCEWPAVPGLPAALAALALLPVAAQLDDTAWWDRRAQGHWSTADYALPLADPDEKPLILDVQALQDSIQTGLTALQDAVTHDALRSFYGQLFAGRFPAGLHLRAPLSPQALAVLLLPLPRPWADRVCLAGGLTARRIAPRDLMRNWDGYATGLGGADQDDSEWDPEVQEMAEAAVAALLDRDLGRSEPTTSPMTHGAAVPGGRINAEDDAGLFSAR